jgi:hypothetical protein
MFTFCSQTFVTSDKHVVHCTSKFCKSSEPTGSDERQLSDKIVFQYIHKDEELLDFQTNEKICFTLLGKQF